MALEAARMVRWRVGETYVITAARAFSAGTSIASSVHTRRFAPRGFLVCQPTEPRRESVRRRFAAVRPDFDRLQAGKGRHGRRRGKSDLELWEGALALATAGVAANADRDVFDSAAGSRARHDQRPGHGIAVVVARVSNSSLKGAVSWKARGSEAEKSEEPAGKAIASRSDNMTTVGGGPQAPPRTV